MVLVLPQRALDIAVHYIIALTKYRGELRQTVSPENIDIQAGGAVPFDGIGVVSLPYKYPAFLSKAVLHRSRAHDPKQREEKREFTQTLKKLCHRLCAFKHRGTDQAQRSAFVYPPSGRTR